MLYALRPNLLTPPVYHRILALCQDLLAQLGEPERSRAADGARRSPGSHPWALAAEGTDQ